VSAKYWLPCACGRNQAVDPADAGQMVRCPCGQSLEVPTLLRLKDLAPVADPVVVAPKSGLRWGLPEQLVSAGVVLVLVALGVAAYFHTAIPRRPSGNEITAPQTLVMWDSLRLGVAGDPADRSAEVFNMIERDYWRRMSILGVVGSVGLVCIAVGLLRGRVRSPKPPPSGSRVA
jgi:hypothetical protein